MKQYVVQIYQKNISQIICTLTVLIEKPFQKLNKMNRICSISVLENENGCLLFEDGRRFGQNDGI